MSLTHQRALELVRPIYPSPPWLAPALTALAGYEGHTHDDRINVYAVGDKDDSGAPHSFGAWQAHVDDWPAVVDAVKASFALAEEQSFVEQAKAIRPIVDDALAQVASVPTWTDDDRAAALNVVWQLGGPDFHKVLAAGAKAFLEGGLPAAAIVVGSIYGDKFAKEWRARAQLYLTYYRELARVVVGAVVDNLTEQVELGAGAIVLIVLLVLIFSRRR